MSKLEALKKGLEKVRKDPLMSVGISLVVVIYWTIPFYIVRYLLGISEVIGAIVLFPVLIVNFLILMGYIKVGFDIYDGEEAGLKDLFYHYKRLPDFLIGFLFYFLLVSIGFVLFVFPAIYFAVRFSFAIFIVLRGSSSAISSMIESWNITRERFFDLMFFYTGLAFINFLGFSLFTVGLALTLPFTLLSLIHLYRKLSESYRKDQIGKGV